MTTHRTKLPRISVLNILGGACLIACIVGPQSLWANELLGIRLAEKNQQQPNKSQTRVVLDMRALTKLSLTTDSAGEWIKLTLPRSKWTSRTKVLESQVGVVKRIQYQHLQDNLQITLRLKQNVDAKHFVLTKPNRLVIDLTPQNTPRLKITLDPGHGGKSAPGAVGPTGLIEKDVALKIAKQLLTKLNATPGIEAFLTRSHDTQLGLAERVAKAKAKSADLFVSLHANAIADRSVRGAAVYILSDIGATKRARRWRTNNLHKKSGQATLAGITLHQYKTDVAYSLYDLIQTNTLSESQNLGAKVLSQLGQVGPIKWQHLRVANFGVLKAPDIPSILVEMAFISNPQDEKILRSKRGQQQISAAVFAGIKQYATELKDRQPEHSSPQRLAITYLVKPGDTLYSIGRRFGVTSVVLRQINNLKSNQIGVGQRLFVATPKQTLALASRALN